MDTELVSLCLQVHFLWILREGFKKGFIFLDVLAYFKHIREKKIFFPLKTLRIFTLWYKKKKKKKMWKITRF